MRKELQLFNATASLHAPVNVNEVLVKAVTRVRACVFLGGLGVAYRANKRRVEFVPA
jgi:hypothetical protein